MKRYDPKSLPYMASITTAVMITRAAVIHFGEWGWLIGPLAGAVSSLSLAVAGSKISDIAAKRKPMAYISLIFMLLLSPLVIYFSEPVPSMGTVMWALLPDAAILLASVVTGQSLIAKPDQQVAQPVTNVTQSKKKVAQQKVTDDKLVAYLKATPNATQAEIAQYFGVSRQAISKRMKKIEEKNK